MKFGKTGYEPDWIDGQLIAALQQDAKASLSRLGEKVGLSAPSVLERVRKLEQAGVITGYHAMVDARQVGLDVAAFIGVVIGEPRRIDDFERWIDGVPPILECHHVTGRHTLLLKVKVRNTRALEELIARVRSFEGVQGTETMVVLSTRVERVQLDLELPEPTEARRKRPRKRAS